MVSHIFSSYFIKRQISFFEKGYDVVSIPISLKDIQQAARCLVVTSMILMHEYCVLEIQACCLGSGIILLIIDKNQEMIT